MRGNWDFVSRWMETKPKQVEHGIKAIHQKGQFCEEWWGKRWMEIIESYHLGERLARGKRYARTGQVIEINFMPGKIKASVQGSQHNPYQVEISVKIWTKKEWDLFFTFIKSDPLLLSQMISGKLTPDLEKKLYSRGINLFPVKYTDFTTDCSCPDWSNPCKHVAAVFFLITEYLDKNPLILFEMRGKDQSEIIENLLPTNSEKELIPTKSVVNSKECPLSVERFWESDQDIQDPIYYTKQMEFDALLIHQMGSFPLWQANDDFFGWWESLYQQNSRKVIEEIEK
ncbi:SWIM zinc finger family protein [bacterium]|nr:SWIM zinc finger family protein [bacterium]